MFPNKLPVLPSIALKALVFPALLFLAACSANQSSGGHHQDAQASGSQHPFDFYTGEITAQALLTDNPNFQEAYDSHQPDAQDIENFKRLAGMDITVFFGIWCHDSQREVPRLLKLIDLSGVELGSLRLVAIDVYKTMPEADKEQFEVRYTPTIFVSQNGQQLASLVERSKLSITKDILQQILF